ncbi:PREDICTED: SUZ domain-containing protein 1-like isoform X1 [Priapulus caudatus]|uniref:SUZ domain-containing protein 1-like isoform X1 n=1 Tax=Priapulus caudatus TaxID=37621 RepID=A0ABM1EZA0_PRICU|nr:PREDICTED: SUZ domain-containing protein 1-like isoform X1 [Priapulus caudatus]
MMASQEDDVDDLESWEDLTDNGVLEKKLLKLESTTEKEPGSDTCGERPTVTEDTHRTQYQPQVRILKRPSGGAAACENGALKGSAQPAKTLEQREAEYAEARLRIMGAASRDDAPPPPPPQNSVRPVIMTIQPDTTIAVGKTRDPKTPDGTTGFSIAR